MAAVTDEWTGGHNWTCPDLSGAGTEVGLTPDNSGDTRFWARPICPASTAPVLAPPEAPKSFHFDVQPSLGAVVMIEGQRYVLVADRPYARADGSQTVLLTWSSHCPRCAGEFTFEASWQNPRVTRRCSPCAAVSKGQRIVPRYSAKKRKR